MLPANSFDRLEHAPFSAQLICVTQRELCQARNSVRKEPDTVMLLSKVLSGNRTALGPVALLGDVAEADLLHAHVRKRQPKSSNQARRVGS